MLQGSFYTEELQKVKYPDVLLVESVIKKKKVGNRRLTSW